ncbi:unnamed protein product, partial [Rotaria magnacalcarata]
MYEVEEHLAPIPGVDINSISEESDFADDSCVEITSNVDEEDDEETQIEKRAKLAEDYNKRMSTQQNKQTALSHFWK